MEDKRKRGGRAAKDQASIAPALHEQHHLLTPQTAPSTVTPWGVCRVCVCVCVCGMCVCVCVGVCVCMCVWGVCVYVCVWGVCVCVCVGGHSREIKGFCLPEYVEFRQLIVNTKRWDCF